MGDFVRSLRGFSLEGDLDLFLNALGAIGESYRFLGLSTGLSLLLRCLTSGVSDRLRSRRSFDLPRRFSSSFLSLFPRRLPSSLSRFSDWETLRCFKISHFMADAGDRSLVILSRRLLADLSRRLSACLPRLTDRERSPLFERDLPLRLSSTLPVLLADLSRRFGSSRFLLSTSFLLPAEGDLLRRFSSSRFLLVDGDLSCRFLSLLFSLAERDLLRRLSFDFVSSLRVLREPERSRRLSFDLFSTDLDLDLDRSFPFFLSPSERFGDLSFFRSLAFSTLRSRLSCDLSRFVALTLEPDRERSFLLEFDLLRERSSILRRSRERLFRPLSSALLPP